VIGGEVERNKASTHLGAVFLGPAIGFTVIHDVLIVVVDAVSKVSFSIGANHEVHLGDTNVADQ
jgi:hypothetical protein